LGPRGVAPNPDGIATLTEAAPSAAPVINPRLVNDVLLFISSLLNFAAS
jgi:hypothetical protein